MSSPDIDIEKPADLTDRTQLQGISHINHAKQNSGDKNKMNRACDALDTCRKVAIRYATDMFSAPVDIIGNFAAFEGRP